MSHRSKSASSAMSVDLVSENGSVPASEYEDSSEGMGGFASDGDDGEEVTWAKERDQQKVGRKLENLSKIHSLAGIVETDAPGLVALRPVKSEGKLKKANIRLRDLPQSLQADFGKIFTPELLRYTGTLPPWQNIDSWAELAELWDPLFPEYTLADDEQLQAVVLKLADDKVTAWRNKFSAAAIEALDALYASWKAYSPEARADVVAWLLQGNDTNRAFYYREYADSEENVVQKGLFQGYLITCGLAAHYTAIRSAAAPIEDPETAEFPETPLVYAIQAAKRALNYSVTGKLVVPGQRLGEFSKANWGDKMDFREGRQVVVNTASSLVAIARKLEDKPQLQKKIMIAAIEASLPKRRAGGKTEVIEIDAGSPTEDIELVDNDSD
ncbi:hypothetical protein B0H17DRAFT_682690 [Mycena rosella]|uniref:Uncharacterized protein n=1 Tax=Mycena rosella TaxID=1033263 RepID=A0AAD7DBD2_MYCRO|nr:hypothetical protein B0H17DRAFT_682690 [Mycena rosella]